jgi:hypothetical protein
MTTITYPEHLPNMLINGYSIKTVSPLQRTELQSGRARQRRRFTGVPVMVTFETVLTQPQAQIFEGFFRWMLEDGAEWFLCNLKTPMGLNQYTCRFVGMYNGPDPITPYVFQVSGDLEIFERDTWNEEWIRYGQSIIMSYGPDFDTAMNREWPPS